MSEDRFGVGYGFNWWWIIIIIVFICICNPGLLGGLGLGGFPYKA